MATKVADALEADACFVYLYDERSNELVLRATHGTSVDGDDPPAAHAPGRGDHRCRRRRALAGDDPVAGASRPALQALPEPPRGAVRVDPRRADPRPRRAARRRAQRPHPQAACLRRRGDRAADGDRRPGRAVDRARAALLRCAAQGGRARSARADLGGGLGVALPRGVARGDRQDDDGRREGDGRRARARGRTDRVAGRARGHSRGTHAAALEAPPDRRARRRPRLAVLRRRPGAARGDRAPRRGRARARARGHARRARARDPPPREEQPADGRVAAAAAVARTRGRSARGARALGQPDPRHRGGARGADRAARGGRRAVRPDRPPAGDARAGARRRPRGGGEPRAGLARRQPRDGAGARVQRAAPERARARRGPRQDRARAPQRRRRARDRRRRRRPGRTQPPAPDCRSSERSSATSSRAASTCATKTRRAPKSCSRR